MDNNTNLLLLMYQFTIIMNNAQCLLISGMLGSLFLNDCGSQSDRHIFAR